MVEQNSNCKCGCSEIRTKNGRSYCRKCGKERFLYKPDPKEEVSEPIEEVVEPIKEPVIEPIKEPVKKGKEPDTTKPAKRQYTKRNNPINKRSSRKYN